MLIDRGATVVAFDPMETARRNAKAQIRRLTVVSSALEAVIDADVIALVTEWPEFATLPWAQIASVVRQRIVIDGRNALDPDVLLEAGFVYSSFGRGHRIPAELEAPAERAAAHEGHAAWYTGRRRARRRRPLGVGGAQAAADRP